MRITHVVVTDAFAGTERYVCEVARRQAERGHDVAVVGGDATSMRRGLGQARWRSAESVRAACARLIADGRRDVVHAHLTFAELAAVITKPIHHGSVVSTRHIAAARGKTWRGGLAAPIVARAVDLEIAISEHVANALERAPHVVLPHGVQTVSSPYDVASRKVLVLQRLEPEKDTATALRAWQASGLTEQGWELLIAGDGGQRPTLERLAGDLGLAGVRFLGHVEDVPDLLAQTAILLAPTPDEALGLSVLEAMSHGVPVVAAACGGHLESLPAGWPWNFSPGDAEAAGAALRALAADVTRTEASSAVRARQVAAFDLERHVDALVELYASSPATRRGPRA